MSCASSQVARNREIGAELSHLTVESSALILMWPRPQGTGKSGMRSGPCSQRGSRAAPILLLCLSQQHDYLAMLRRKECNAALASVMSAFKAGELEPPGYAYALYASFSASWFSSPYVSWPCVALCWFHLASEGYAQQVKYTSECPNLRPSICAGLTL